MTWASQRRFIIVSIIVLVFLFIIAVTLIATLHKTPSCSDGIQNQDEAGIDCGGSCAYLCMAQVQPPTTLFTRVLANSSGRTDIMASYANKNLTAAVKGARYQVALYSADRALVKTLSGMVDLAPASGSEGGKFLLFLPGASNGPETIATANLEFDASTLHWFVLSRDPRIVPRVGNYTLTNESSVPRITAILTNPSTKALINVKTYVSVFDAEDNVIAASQTVVPSIPALGTASAIFTWEAPFKAPVARVQIFPVIPLP